MTTKKITQDEIADMRVAALPTRPTAPAAFGGRGYTASELKAAFDRLPLYIIECFNRLIDDISAEFGGIADDIKTSIPEAPTLKEFFEDVKNGNLSAYLKTCDGRTLEERLSALANNKT